MIGSATGFGQPAHFLIAADRALFRARVGKIARVGVDGTLYSSFKLSFARLDERELY